MTRSLVAAATGLALAASAFIPPASALSDKECAARYQAAKHAGMLDGRNWTDFRKDECGAALEVDPSAVPARTAQVPSAAPVPTVSSAAFPAAVDPKYVREEPSKARLHTCLDGFKAARTAGTLGATKWIEKGGGYYPQCDAWLKG